MRREPAKLVVRGFYREQLQRYLDCFPAAQIKTVLFEELAARPQAAVDQLCAFLRLEGGVDLNKINPHQHPAHPLG